MGMGDALVMVTVDMVLLLDCTVAGQRVNPSNASIGSLFLSRRPNEMLDDDNEGQYSSTYGTTHIYSTSVTVIMTDCTELVSLFSLLCSCLSFATARLPSPRLVPRWLQRARIQRSMR